MLPECNYQFMSDCLQIRVGIKLTGTRVDYSTPQNCKNIRPAIFFVVLSVLVSLLYDRTDLGKHHRSILSFVFEVSFFLDNSDNR